MSKIFKRVSFVPTLMTLAVVGYLIHGLFFAAEPQAASYDAPPEIQRRAFEVEGDLAKCDACGCLRDAVEYILTGKGHRQGRKDLDRAHGHVGTGYAPDHTRTKLEAANKDRLLEIRLRIDAINGLNCLNADELAKLDRYMAGKYTYYGYHGHPIFDGYKGYKVDANKNTLPAKHE